METGEKKFINGCISREIIKIILKLVVTIGLTFLAVRYDFFVIMHRSGKKTPIILQE